MRRPSPPPNWPLTAKLPAFTAMVVVAVAAAMSTALLFGIAREQRDHTAALGNAYLEGVAASLGPALARRDVWDAYDTLDRNRQAFGPGRLVLAVAALPDGLVLASTDPKRLRVGAPVPAEIADGGQGAAAAGDGDLLRMARDVVESGIRLGRVAVELDTAPEHRARVQVAELLLAANAVVATLSAGLVWWLTRRMLRPVRLLTRQFGHGAAVAPRAVDAVAFERFGPEFIALFRTYNQMVRAAEERGVLAARLAEEERLATLGALAGSMAHEVNNPLGGMLMAVDTLSVHGADESVRLQALGLLRRGLENIRTIVRATLVIHKAGSEPGLLTPDALDDLRYLAGPAAARSGVSLAWDNRLEGAASVDIAAVRQAVLNVILNAVAASPPKGVVRFTADRSGGMLRIQVGDDGPGRPPDAASVLASPGSKPPPGSGGLGLWTAARAVNAAGGSIRRASSAAGTALVLLFPMEARHAVPAP